ncbi:MAG TPA: nitronate monooxygenase [Bacillota bacterium]|nr:nitronate monooxygenase [Bacillota bacterium]
MEAMKELKFGDLTAKLPIIQGGMGVGVSLSGLAAAVANEGGVGVIATAAIGMFEPDFGQDFLKANINALRKEIRRAREMTKGIIGVNIMVALSNFADMVKTAIDEKVDIIFSGAGLPLNLPQFLEKNSRTKLVPIVSSARAAALIIKRWADKYNYVPDAVVVEGPKAGGHLGFSAEQLTDPAFSLENLIPLVIAEVKPFEEKYQKAIPVIAAGGIYTGADIYNFIEMGAAGVQMATRFVTTEECDAAPEFKQTYLDSEQKDLVIIKSPVGLLGRAFKNSFLEDVFQGKKKPFNCPFHCITTCDVQKSPYCIALALINAQKGNLKHGFAFSGTNGYIAKKIISVKELINSLVDEYGFAAKPKPE